MSEKGRLLYPVLVSPYYIGQISFPAVQSFEFLEVNLRPFKLSRRFILSESPN